MSNNFKLLMLGAMYENGGNTTHRFLDGHPELFVYPFESQIGSKLVNDQMSSLFPVKYRWPVFALDATPYQDYKAIIDEKIRTRYGFPESAKDSVKTVELDGGARHGSAPRRGFQDLEMGQGRAAPVEVGEA